MSLIVYNAVSPHCKSHDVVPPRPEDGALKMLHFSLYQGHAVSRNAYGSAFAKEALIGGMGDVPHISRIVSADR